jgi:hypothetical protein
MALGLFGVLVAFLYPAIVLVVAMLAAVTAIVLGVAALAARKRHRKRLALRAIGLAVATAAWTLAYLGAVDGPANAAVVFLLPMLIGIAAIGLGIASLSSRSVVGRGLAKLGLVLGIATVLMCLWSIARVSEPAVRVPNVPPASQTKPTKFGAVGTAFEEAAPWTRPKPGLGAPQEKPQVTDQLLERTTGFEPATPTLAKNQQSATTVR